MVVAPIKTVKADRVLILGAFGMLGHALQKVFPEAERRGRDLDITDEDAVSACIRALRPKVVINAAGYTDTEGCEDHQEMAYAVNGEGAGYIARACRRAGALLVHYSSDYVFDGTQREYVESDQPHPINVYGRSKLLGEERIMEEMDEYRIIRTSWLFGRHGRNFVDTILHLSHQMDVVRVVDDQIGRPTYTADLAARTPSIILSDPGIYHITNEGSCSWYEFARAFIPNAVPCSSAAFPRKAVRPAYSILINTRTTPMRHWREALEAYLRECDR